MKINLNQINRIYIDNKAYFFFVFFYILNYFVSPILFINAIYISSIRRYINSNFISQANILIILFIVFTSIFYFNFKDLISKRIRIPKFVIYRKTGLIFLIFLILVSISSRLSLLYDSLFSGEYLIEDRAFISRGKGVIELLASCSTVLIPFLLFNYLQFSRKLFSKLTYFTLMIFLTASLFVRGSRSLILEAILPFIFYKFQNNKNALYKYFLISSIGFLGLIFLFFRVGIENFQGNLFIIIGTLYMMTFSNYEILLATISNLEPFQLGFGTTFFESVFYQFIPRFIWTDKPMLYGTAKITESFADWWERGISVPADMISDAYINFGYFGILLYSLILSIILAYLSLILRDQSNRIGRNSLIFTAIVFIYTFMLQRIFIGSLFDLITKSAILYFLYNIARKEKIYDK